MKNFTISLYAFHLARTFNDPDTIFAKNAQLFGEELQKRIVQTIPCKHDLTTLLLHDTYFVDLTFFASETEDFTPEKIQQFQPAALIPENVQASLGQTLIIYGEVDSKQAANLDLANDYVRNFLQNTPYNTENITAANQAKLSYISLFEYFCQTTQKIDTTQSVCHILVLLNYLGETSREKLETHYNDLAELLCSYHKIRFVYQESEKSYAAARKIAQTLETKIDEFDKLADNKSQHLDKLSQMLESLPKLALDYSLYCRELEDHLNTIDINRRNYQQYLQTLLAAGSQLDSWQKTSDTNFNLTHQQIQFYLNYLTPRKEIGQQLTAAIRGIVEIEQAKRERSLQKTIEALGIGIGAGGIFASATSGHIKTDVNIPPWNQNNSINLAGVICVLLSFGISVGGVIITAKLNGKLSEWRSYWQKRQQSQLETAKPQELPQSSNPSVSLTTTETEKEKAQ